MNLNGQAPRNQPVELGQVKWLRDLDEGIAKSKQEGKPVFLLFQEIPGCQTCQRYGQEVLSHPLVAEAIESLFIPVAIYNNRQGKDAEALRAYNEPAWNNPVVRIVGSDRKDLTERVNGNYSPLGIVQAMVAALEKKNTVVPGYLALLQEELQSKALGVEKTTLSMYCFWTGEREIGKLPGVVSTEAGYMNGHEVVQVEYNPRLLSFETLLKKAGAVQCADGIFTNDPTEKAKAAQVIGKEHIKSAGAYRTDPENKYGLYNGPYRYVPMTSLQATRANVLFSAGKTLEDVLSPRQIALAKNIKANPNKGWKPAIGKDIREGASELLSN
jgi:hypothetical protein